MCRPIFYSTLKRPTLNARNFESYDLIHMPNPEKKNNLSLKTDIVFPQRRIIPKLS